jgi:aryl-alcohol dehydrogenase-like predicted oxidoreductase
MDYRYLGRTGLRVSELCFGSMLFGEVTDEETSHGLLDRFTGAGGTFIDTSDNYSRGASEEILGRWLAGRQRADLVIATKVRGRMGDSPTDEGLSRQHILKSIDDSLRRLRTDYVDLYQIHYWDPDTPLEETLSTMDTLVRSGKVRYAGASNVKGYQLQKALGVAGKHGWEPFVSLQPCYSLLVRAPEWELLPLCRQEGLAVVPFSPLAKGWLSGRYRRGMAEPPADSRIASAAGRMRWGEYGTEHTWTVLDALHAVAAETGHTPAQVALNWLLGTPGVTAPVIGARTQRQLDDNLGATGWSLTPEQQARLDDASATVAPYPYSWVPD